MAQSKEKKPLDLGILAALGALLTITVNYVKPAIKRHPNNLTTGKEGHDFLGYASVSIEFNKAFFRMLGEASRTNPALAPLVQALLQAIAGFKLGLYSLEVKRFRKSGLFNVSSKNVQGDDGKWRPMTSPLTAELYKVIETVVLADARVQAALTACNAMPIPAPIGGVQGSVSAAPTGANPFDGQAAPQTASAANPFGS